MKLHEKIRTYFRSPLHRVMALTVILLLILNLLSIPTRYDFRKGEKTGIPIVIP